MSVYAPGDTPPVDPNADPGMWARLMGYVGGLSPIGSAQADTMAQGPNPAANPSPVDPRLAGGGPPVPQALMSGAQQPPAMDPTEMAARRRLASHAASLAAGGPPQLSPASPSTASLNAVNYGGLPPSVSTVAPNSQNGLPTTFGGGTFGQGGPPPQVMPYAGGQGTVGPAGQPGSHTLLQPSAPNNAVGWGTPQSSSDVNWALDPRLPDYNKLPAAAGSAAQRKPVRKPVKIPASATANVPPAGSPWVTRDAQNQDWSGGALARGGTRQMGMLDLSKLFGQR